MALLPYTDEIFPPVTANIGLAWNNTKTPSFSTLVRESESGVDFRVTNRVYPKWTWTLEYKKLDEDASVDNQLHALVGFFLERRGAYQSFLFRDTEDYTLPPHNSGLTRQPIGVADGATKKFQVVRTYLGFVEPITDFADLNVWVNGIQQGGGWDHVDGLITFNTAPTTGLIEVVSNTFYHRVRFLDDELEVEQFMERLWTAQSVSLVTARK